jgi:integrase
VSKPKAKAKVSFRPPNKQAAHAVRQMAAHGTPRHGREASGQIHSQGTERAYEQALTGLVGWLQLNKKGDLRGLTEADAVLYLAGRAEMVGQKTLDLDRQAISAYLGVKLAPIKSGLATHKQSRAYIPRHIDMVAAAQSPQHALATAIAAAAGLRAQELLTLRLATERPADQHRQYRDDRFIGMEGIRYTVEGKGGLCREVMLTQALANKLEANRLAQPVTVYDRGVKYQQHYAIGGGLQWSSSFGKASMRALGWTTGAHGLRHTYAQLRVIAVQMQNYSFGEAKLVVSQEMGHFRASVIDEYLR